jgi:hypothetical protein
MKKFPIVFKWERSFGFCTFNVLLDTEERRIVIVSNKKARASISTSTSLLIDQTPAWQKGLLQEEHHQCQVRRHRVLTKRGAYKKDKHGVLGQWVSIHVPKTSDLAGFGSA